MQAEESVTSETMSHVSEQKVDEKLDITDQLPQTITINFSENEKRDSFKLSGVR